MNMAQMRGKAYQEMLPYVSVALYMGGLFLIVHGTMVFGFSCVAIGTVLGIAAGVSKFKKKYKPSRQTHPKWMKFFGIKDRS